MKCKLLAKMFSIWFLSVIILVPTIGSFGVQAGLYLALIYGAAKKYFGGSNEE